MARIARVVVPGIPHHITQRGNRRMDTSFSEGDYREYLSLMAEWCNRCKVQVWAYCLMTNHVHLIVVPESIDGLRRAIGEAHRRCSRYINFQNGWTGHLWQGRFGSFPMDEQYLITAARYIELNPIKAGIVKKPEDFKWSSAKAHLQCENDILVEVEPLLSIIPDWQDLLSGDLSVEEYEILRRHERSGRPLGSDGFMVRLEQLTSRVLRRKKPGPKKR
jgi:putative transposase